MIKLSKLEIQRKVILDNLAKEQQIKVSTGETYIINGEEKKAKWYFYKTFNPKYRLRQVLDNEIVIEFDIDNKLEGWKAINQTAINLYNAGIVFSIWDHKGRSPHIHIHNLPITHLDKNKRSLFKKLFQKKYVPEQYHKYIDTTLCGTHLVRLEYSPCFKNKYGIKELVYQFNPIKDNLKSK